MTEQSLCPQKSVKVETFFTKERNFLACKYRLMKNYSIEMKCFDVMQMFTNVECCVVFFIYLVNESSI